MALCMSVSSEPDYDEIPERTSFTKSLIVKRLCRLYKSINSSHGIWKQRDKYRISITNSVDCQYLSTNFDAECQTVVHFTRGW